MRAPLISLAIATYLLSGCASLTTRSPVLPPQGDLMEPCERPIRMIGRTQKEYDLTTIENASRAHDCADKADLLQEWIRGIKQ